MRGATEAGREAGAKRTTSRTERGPAATLAEVCGRADRVARAAEWLQIDGPGWLDTLGEWIATVGDALGSLGDVGFD